MVSNLRNQNSKKISLGVSVAYFSSIAELAISASKDPNVAIISTGSRTYFDSVVFLTLFLLIGRYAKAIWVFICTNILF